MISYYSLVGTGHLDKGAIISAAGDSTWAATSGFTVRLTLPTPFPDISIRTLCLPISLLLSLPFAQPVGRMRPARSITCAEGAESKSGQGDR